MILISEKTEEEYEGNKTIGLLQCHVNKHLNCENAFFFLFEFKTLTHAPKYKLLLNLKDKTNNNLLFFFKSHHVTIER